MALKKPFQQFTINPSFEIVSRLPPSLSGGITVIAHPDPLEPAYHSLLEAAPRLIRDHDPDIVVHVGLAADQTYFSLEQSARRDGYHQTPDAARRVLTKAESRTAWGRKCPDVLETSFDLSRVLESWGRRLRALSSGGGGGGGKGHGKGSRGKGGNAGDNGSNKSLLEDIDARHTDDVDSYVCGLVYYASLAALAERRRDGARYAVFLHVPPFAPGAAAAAAAVQEEDWRKGSSVLAALLEALAEVWRQTAIR